MSKKNLIGIVMLVLVLQLAGYSHDDSGLEVASVSGSGSHPMVNVGASRSSTNNVLNRVSSQQDKWKKQVLEQRRNIYDRHTMLN